MSRDRDPPPAERVDNLNALQTQFKSAAPSGIKWPVIDRSNLLGLARLATPTNLPEDRQADPNTQQNDRRGFGNDAQKDRTRLGDHVALHIVERCGPVHIHRITCRQLRQRACGENFKLSKVLLARSRILNWKAGTNSTVTFYGGCEV